MSLLKIKAATRANCKNLFSILCTYPCKASTFPKLLHRTNLYHKRIFKARIQLGCLWSISSWPLICHGTELGSYVFISHLSLLICSNRSGSQAITALVLWENVLVLSQRSHDSLNKDRSLLIYTYLYITIHKNKNSYSFGAPSLCYIILGAQCKMKIWNLFRIIKNLKMVRLKQNGFLHKPCRKYLIIVLRSTFNLHLT